MPCYQICPINDDIACCSSCKQRNKCPYACGWVTGEDICKDELFRKMQMETRFEYEDYLEKTKSDSYDK